MAQQNGSSGNDFLVKAGLAQMLKGGVIMDVVNAEQVGLQLALCRQLPIALEFLG
jgi:pyridoxal biosynthesis lyase PdxS